jgi:hypothetical protein
MHFLYNGLRDTGDSYALYIAFMKNKSQVHLFSIALFSFPHFTL